MDTAFILSQLSKLTQEVNKSPQDLKSLLDTIAITEAHVLGKGCLSFGAWIINRQEYAEIASKVQVADSGETKAAEFDQLRATLTDPSELEQFDDAQIDYINYLAA